MLNIVKMENGVRTVMLGCNVSTYIEAMHWLDYYRMTYDYEFYLCRYDEEYELYCSIH